MFGESLIRGGQRYRDGSKIPGRGRFLSIGFFGVMEREVGLDVRSTACVQRCCNFGRATPASRAAATAIEWWRIPRYASATVAMIKAPPATTTSSRAVK